MLAHGYTQSASSMMSSSSPCTVSIGALELGRHLLQMRVVTVWATAEPSLHPQSERRGSRGKCREASDRRWAMPFSFRVHNEMHVARQCDHILLLVTLLACSTNAATWLGVLMTQKLRKTALLDACMRCGGRSVHSFSSGM